jgi:hypothetical protein
MPVSRIGSNGRLRRHRPIQLPPEQFDLLFQCTESYVSGFLQRDVTWRDITCTASFRERGRCLDNS